MSLRPLDQILVNMALAPTPDPSFWHLVPGWPHLLYKWRLGRGRSATAPPDCIGTWGFSHVPEEGVCPARGNCATSPPPWRPCGSPVASFGSLGEFFAPQGGHCGHPLCSGGCLRLPFCSSWLHFCNSLSLLASPFVFIWIPFRPFSLHLLSFRLLFALCGRFGVSLGAIIMLFFDPPLPFCQSSAVFVGFGRGAMSV